MLIPLKKKKIPQCKKKKKKKPHNVKETSDIFRNKPSLMQGSDLPLPF